MRRQIALVLLIGTGLAVGPVRAGAADSVQWPIVRLDTMITLKLSLNSESEGFTLQGSDFLYDIRPNVSWISRIHFNYRFLAFRIGYLPKVFPGNRDNAIEGKTKLITLESYVFTRHWSEELANVKVRGFYLHNTGDFMPGWTEGSDPYIQFPDLRFIAFRGATTYKFNPDLSLKAVKNQTEMQLRNQGSWLTQLSYSYYITDNQSDDATQTSSQRTDNIEIIFSGGYIYNLVIGRHWLASAELTPGGCVVWTKLTTRLPEGDVHTRYSSAVFRLQEHLRIGYQSSRFFCGMEANFWQSRQKQGSSQVTQGSNRSTWQVFAGYHFTAPGFLKRSRIFN